MPSYESMENAIKVGDKIKILRISKEFLRKLPDDEISELKTMIGEIHEVIEIEEWGGVWVEKEFAGDSENQVSYHKLCLAPEEIEKII